MWKKVSQVEILDDNLAANKTLVADNVLSEKQCLIEITINH